MSYNMLMADKRNSKLTKLLAGAAFAGLAAIKVSSGSSRRVANAVNNEVIHERLDQHSGAGDDLPDPRKYVIFVTKENEETDLGYDLYMLSREASPVVQTKKFDDYVKAVIKDAENGIDQLETYLAEARNED
jgi:hypothetical protein